MPSDPLFLLICFIGNSKRSSRRSNQEFETAFFLTCSSVFSHDIMSREAKIYPAHNTVCELQNTLAFLQSQLCITQMHWPRVPNHLRTSLNTLFKFILYYIGNLHGHTLQIRHYIFLPLTLHICLLLTTLSCLHCFN